MAQQRRVQFAIYIRNFIFGVEDSLVSTVGLISGIAAAGVAKNEILLTGIVLIFVEAFSMAVGSFLSERSAEEYLNYRRFSSHKLSLTAGTVMFASYFASGFVPLAPYLVFDFDRAFPASIGFSLVALFLLGAISGRIFRRNFFRSALRMLIVGGLAIAIGVVVGQVLQ